MIKRLLPVRKAQDNIDNANLSDYITVERKEFL